MNYSLGLGIHIIQQNIAQKQEKILFSLTHL